MLPRMARRRPLGSRLFDARTAACARVSRGASLPALLPLVAVVACTQPASEQAAVDEAASAPTGSATTTRFDPAKPASIHTLDEAVAVADALRAADTRLALARELQPSAADYVAVFGPDYGPALEARLRKAWAADKVQPGPWGPDQTGTRVFGAMTADFVQQSPEAKRFPRGYLRIAEFLTPEQTFFAFRYVRPNEAAGAGYDALVRVGDKWRFFPKPWLAAEAGSKFFRPNAAERVCMTIRDKALATELAAPNKFDSCVHQMSKRAEDYGAAGFEAYARCVDALEQGAELESCKPQRAGG